ncbi:hypothetical protein AAEU32_11260 [Pseudoalteromonas sp. SSDWG2]|uniref:hypothetical protein n=1 Tax=Pseudoalteromonas sp. SSDWG2 TaxID=3139391 RepID=UPI003BAA5119
MSATEPYIDLSTLSSTELFTLWLCLHANYDNAQVKQHLHDALASGVSNARRLWLNDIDRQLEHKGMPTAQQPKDAGEFADFLFCLLSKVPMIEQEFANEIFLVQQIDSQQHQNGSNVSLAHWVSDVVH